jgi:serine/threonine protein kinase
VERLACGLAKLLLIDPDHPRFEDLVVAPAERLRLYVREQLNALDAHAYGAGLQCERGSRASGAIGGEEVGSYRLLERIAEGSMACVYRAVHRVTGAVVAVKRVRVPRDGNERESAEREVQMYELLRERAHPNILQFHEVVRTPDGTCIVMEYADGGSLWDLVVEPDGLTRRLSLEDALRVVAPLVDAVRAMHELGLVHRDIKPQNVLRSDDQWKLADFGISKWMGAASTGGTFQGAHSAPWAPPEQMEGAPAHPSADVYAIGRVLAFLLTGSKERKAIQSLDAPWQELLNACLADEPADRFTVAAVAQHLAASVSGLPR